jgi:hypothetical protein
MPTDHSQWLPPKAANNGPRDVPYWALMAVALLCTVRSLIHMLATDGGAHSIAGIAVSGVAGSNLVAIFGQWGASQLLLAVIYWVVLVRYRTLVPLMWLVVWSEQVLRFVEGHALKPLTTTEAPPGLYFTYGMLIVSSAILCVIATRNHL